VNALFALANKALPQRDYLVWDHPELFLTGLLVTLPILYLAVWIHELGHVIVGKLLGIRVTAAGAGTGGRIACARVFGIAFYVASRNPFQGLTYADADSYVHRGRTAAFFGGGILANALVAGLTFAFMGLTPTMNWWFLVWLFGFWNAFAPAVSGIPYIFRVVGRKWHYWIQPRFSVFF
jgi:hypothetical protein